MVGAERKQADKAMKMVRKQYTRTRTLFTPSTCLTCLLWTLSASAQRKLRAVLHTGRTVCRWGCNSGSCQRFWSHRPQTLSVYGNVASASGFPLWKNLQGVEICEYGWWSAIVLGKLILTHRLLNDTIIIRRIMGINGLKERPCHFVRLLKKWEFLNCVVQILGERNPL